MPIWLGIVIGVVCFLAGAALMFLVPFVRNNIVKNNAKKIIRDAEIKAEHITKNAQLDGKQAVNELKQEANREIHERKQELQQQERSLQQREQSIDRRDAALLAKENSLDEKNETLSRRLKELELNSKKRSIASSSNLKKSLKCPPKKLETNSSPEWNPK